VTPPTLPHSQVQAVQLARQESQPQPQLSLCPCTHTTVLRTFFWDHLAEPVPEENFWTLWRKGILIEADTLTIWLGATPSGLTSVHLHHPLIFFMGWMPFLLPNQQC